MGRSGRRRGISPREHTETRNTFWAGCAAAVAVPAGAGGTARAEFIVAEVEPSNAFAAQQVLPAGPGQVTGSVAPGTWTTSGSP
ncbi:MAG: hypothetical protein C0501_20370 [Isosphaera sp.]|nr:hypothetical protein [Isosphaera sp.]